MTLFWNRKFSTLQTCWLMVNCKIKLPAKCKCFTVIRLILMVKSFFPVKGPIVSLYRIIPIKRPVRSNVSHFGWALLRDVEKQCKNM